MTHSEKIQYAKTDLAYWCNLLQSEYDIMVAIKKVGAKNFQVLQNFEIVKQYRARRSARLYKTIINL